MALYMWLKPTKVRSQTELDEIINEEAKSSNTLSPTADVDDCGHGSKSTELPQEEKKAEKVPLKRKINQRWFEEFDWIEQDNGKLRCKLCTRVSDAHANHIIAKHHSNSQDPSHHKHSDFTAKTSTMNSVKYVLWKTDPL